MTAGGDLPLPAGGSDTRPRRRRRIAWWAIVGLYAAYSIAVFLAGDHLLSRGSGGVGAESAVEAAKARFGVLVAIGPPSLLLSAARTAGAMAAPLVVAYAVLSVGVLSQARRALLARDGAERLLIRLAIAAVFWLAAAVFSGVLAG